nr:hypothetical protein [Aliamphritea hakodatensis]
MKRLRYALAAVTAVCVLGLGGCAVLESVGEKAAEVHAHVKTLKEKGCASLSVTEKRVLVAAIKLRVPDYPPNGICSPVWVQDVLVEQLGELDDEGGVYNGSDDLGYSAGPSGRDGSLVESGGTEVSFSDSGSGDIGAGWVSDGSGNYSVVGALVHVSGFDAHSGGGSDPRLLLYASVQQHEQIAGGSGAAGGYGVCDSPGLDVEAQCCVGGCASGWSRRLVA